MVDMYVKRHEFFRWTSRTAFLTFTYVIAVPSVFLYMGFATDVSLHSLRSDGGKAVRLGRKSRFDAWCYGQRGEGSHL